MTAVLVPHLPTAFAAARVQILVSSQGANVRCAESLVDVEPIHSGVKRYMSEDLGKEVQDGKHELQEVHLRSLAGEVIQPVVGLMQRIRTLDVRILLARREGVLKASLQLAAGNRHLGAFDEIQNGSELVVIRRHVSIPEAALPKQPATRWVQCLPWRQQTSVPLPPALVDELVDAHCNAQDRVARGCLRLRCEDLPAKGKVMRQDEHVVVCCGEMHGRFVAVKRIPIPTVASEVDDVLRERNLLASVSCHPFILPLVGTAADSQCLFAVTEFLPAGRLHTLMRVGGVHRRLPGDVVQFYVSQLASVLTYLHFWHSIVHRQLCPENILLHADGHLKLGNFSLAKKLCSPSGRTSTLCGIPEFVAPEAIKGRTYGVECDLWALGILCYELLTGFPPFRLAKQQPNAVWDLWQRVLREPVRFPPSDIVTAPAADLIRTLLQRDPVKRRSYLSESYFDNIDWAGLHAGQCPVRNVPVLCAVVNADEFTHDVSVRDNGKCQCPSFDDW